MSLQSHFSSQDVNVFSFSRLIQQNQPPPLCQIICEPHRVRPQLGPRWPRTWNVGTASGCGNHMDSGSAGGASSAQDLGPRVRQTLGPFEMRGQDPCAVSGSTGARSRGQTLLHPTPGTCRAGHASSLLASISVVTGSPPEACPWQLETGSRVPEAEPGRSGSIARVTFLLLVDVAEEFRVPGAGGVREGRGRDDGERRHGA